MYNASSPLIRETRWDGKSKIELMRTINVSKNYYPHDIHHETPSKMLSLITYMSPDIDQGTHLYSTQNESALEKVIEWKPNRSMFFYGVNNKTWHSYIAGDQFRVTIGQFLVLK